MTEPVMAIGGPPGKVQARTADWADNGDLIADVARLGYIVSPVLDPTYGEGTFWKAHAPELSSMWFVGTDIDPDKRAFQAPFPGSDPMFGVAVFHHDRWIEPPPPGPVDFTDLPYPDRAFATVVFDPPYKLNGTPSAAEERYGVHVSTRWQDRLDLILRGTDECARVADEYLLVKCMDQVVSGHVVWQTDLVTETANLAGFDKVDRFDFIGGRVQDVNRTKKCPAPMHSTAGPACELCNGTGRVPSEQEHARRYSSTLLVFRRA